MKSIPLLFSLIFVFVSLIFISIGCSSRKRIVTSIKVESKVIKEARRHIGSPYKYGARGPKSFDCSGLVEYVFSNQGRSISGSAAQMSKLAKAKKINKSNAGDLIFYKSKGKVTHVSIISKVRPNQLWVIHSTSSRGVVEEEILNSEYWRNKIYKIIAFTDLR